MANKISQNTESREVELEFMKSRACLFFLGLLSVSVGVLFKTKLVEDTAAPSANAVTVEFPVQVKGADGVDMSSHKSLRSCLKAETLPLNMDCSIKRHSRPQMFTVVTADLKK